VRLKKDSQDEGTIWQLYLKIGMKLSQVRSEKDKLTEHRVEVLEITKERKKYLIEKILEPYYGGNDPSKAELL